MRSIQRHRHHPRRRAAAVSRLLCVALACTSLLVGSVVSQPSASSAASSAPTVRSATENLGGSAAGFPSPQGTLDGHGQIVVVIDGAFNPTHPALAGRVLEEACFGSPSPVEDLTRSACSSSASRRSFAGIPVQFETGRGVSRPNPKCVDPDGTLCHAVHGTAVASAAVGAHTELDGESVGGIASGAQIVLIKVGVRDRWNTEVVPAALGYVHEVLLPRYGTRLAAVNLSASLDGTPVADSAHCPSNAFSTAAAQVKRDGIAVTVAAGNAGLHSGTGLWSCQESVVAVGSTNVATLNTLTPGPSELSNPIASDASARVDLLVPVGSPRDAGSADGIWVAWPYRPKNDDRYENNYNKPQGTSFAAPQIAGAFAVLRQRFGASKNVDELVAMMAGSGVRVEDTRAKNQGIVMPRVWLSAVTDPRTTPEWDFTGDGDTDVPLLAASTAKPLMLFPVSPRGVVSNPGTIVVDSWADHASTVPVADFGARNSNGFITTTGADLVYHRFDPVRRRLDGGKTVLSGGAAGIAGMTFAQGLPATSTGSGDAIVIQKTNGSIVARRREQFGLLLGAETTLVTAAVGAKLRLVGVTDITADGSPDLVVRDAAGYPAVFRGTGRPSAPFSSVLTRLDSGTWWPGVRQMTLTAGFAAARPWIGYRHAQGNLVHIPMTASGAIAGGGAEAVGSGPWVPGVRYLMAPRPD